MEWSGGSFQPCPVSVYCAETGNSDAYLVREDHCTNHVQLSVMAKCANDSLVHSSLEYVWCFLKSYDDKKHSSLVGKLLLLHILRTEGADWYFKS